jgi:hypothetical protein
MYLANWFRYFALVALLPEVATQWNARASVAKHHEGKQQSVLDELHALHEPWPEPLITICGLYYDDPYYIKHQIASWKNYTATQRGQLEFVIIDDGSPNHPAIESIDDATKKELNIRIYRYVAREKPRAQLYAYKVQKGLYI